MADTHASGEPLHTVLTVLRGAEAWFQRRGVEAPKRSAELLLGFVLGLTRLELYLAHDRPLTPVERDRMRALTARRGEGEPVAHLLGSWSFRGLELDVDASVLVPRPETEELVDLAIEHAPKAATALDLGTGSGAIAIALAVARPQLRVVAVDVSQNALAVARRNVERHGLTDRIELRHGSWWQPIAAHEGFDLVVSNPPYIDPQAPLGLADDVRRFEPPLALFSAPGDPASCYRELAAGLARHLVAGGCFVAETGLGAAGPALAVLRATTGLVDVELRRDLAGAERFVLARQP